MKFYLGTHMPAWLGKSTVPLCISQRRLIRQHSWPRAVAPWALDSGGFTELSMFGDWMTTEDEYDLCVRTYQEQIGQLQWCAPQDWMCEPFILRKTGLSVAEHQRRTIESFLSLRARGLPVIPVLQGWTLPDYLAHVDAYTARGVDLTLEHTVGVGSVCRRQATDEIALIVATLNGMGLNLHGFGVKTDGLRKYGWLLTSADSMAWSFRGRHVFPCPHTGAKSCANCLPHALAWRLNALLELDAGVQLSMGFS